MSYSNFSARELYQWLTYPSGGMVVPRNPSGKVVSVKILQRYHFNSQLKRMSVVASYVPPGSSEITHVAAVKGAPETIRKMVRKDPP